MPANKILFLCDASDVDIVERSFAGSEKFEPTVETTERILEYGVPAYLERTIELMNKYPSMYDGVVGTHDSSAVFASIIAEKTGNHFASVQSIINCQNKYLSRMIQQACLPEQTPAFCLALDYLREPSRLEPPFFIKPVRGNISFGTHSIDSPEELHYCIGRESLDIAKHNQYFLDALSMDPGYLDPLNVQTCNSFLCEELLTGVQVTIDGFIFEGRVEIFGMTRAVFFPESNSFSHHEFPAAFSSELHQRILQAIERLIPEHGLDNSFFNVEIRADEATQRFAILEINSRIAFQFAKTIEAVTGYDPLHLLCDVAVGHKPEYDSSAEKTFKHCFNFELHSFENKRILKTPTQSDFEELNIRYPEVQVRNLIQENSLLSDYKHNPESYRYCILDIPGQSPQEIQDKHARVVATLNYEFAETYEA